MTEPSGIGKTIRKIRMRLNLTLRQVADKAGITTSALSQLEREQFDPTIGTLRRIAGALNVTLGTFFPSSDGEEQVVVTAKQRKTLSPKEGITYYLLTPNLAGQVEFILSVYKPGASSGDESLSYSAEQCGLVLKGAAEVHLGDKVHLLHEGDSIRFDCLIPHKIVNVGRGNLHCIWAISPPAF